MTAALLLLALVSTTHLHAQEWTRFRGPNGAGQSEATTIPNTWTEKDYLWQTELPGVVIRRRCCGATRSF